MGSSKTRVIQDLHIEDWQPLWGPSLCLHRACHGSTMEARLWKYLAVHRKMAYCSIFNSQPLATARLRLKDSRLDEIIL